MITRMMNLATSLFLVVMSADLLYLFFAGAWYDSNWLVRSAEVISLVIICTTSFCWFTILLKRLLSEH